MRKCWYQQPVVWLGALIFIASLAGCIAMVAVASRYSDDASPPVADQVLKMPIMRTPQSAQPPAFERPHDRARS